MAKDKAATSVAHTMKRRFHMEGKKIKPSILEFTSSSVVFVDIRSSKNYVKYHLRHAFHIPADIWSKKTVLEFAEHLESIYFKEVLQNICCTSHHHDHLGTYQII